MWITHTKLLFLRKHVLVSHRRRCSIARSEFSVSFNQLVGTVPAALAARFPLNSPVWSSNCLVNVASRFASCDMPERSALVDLYTSTNGYAWLSKSNWLSAVHPCSWFGVSCLVDGVGPVVSLSLPANGLSGSLPESLSALTSLE